MTIMSQALRIENAARVALGFPDEMNLLAALVSAGSIKAGQAFSITLASLTPYYREHRTIIDAFAERNSHLVGQKFSDDNAEQLRTLANDFYFVLEQIGVLTSR